jgi:trimeric autotransporter adhesin
MRTPAPLASVLARALALLACGIAPLGAAPLSSAFTYQGELYDAGQPAIGSYDLRFTPYADANNPVLLGPPVVVEDVVVSNGVFTAQVDFGPGFFVGDAVFLEVAVRPFESTDANAFEALTPRQEITATPYSLKPAPGSVTDIELAPDAVGSPQLADGSVGSGDITDAGVLPQDLDLTAFESTFWRVGGNTGAASTALGRLDNQPLSLLAPVGVTINGARINNNTELTIRGNPNTTEANADLTLWPRGGEAFFNLAVLPNPSNAISTPANTSLLFSTVGTNPSTGFVARAQMAFDGSFGIGGNNPAPHARLHVSRVDQGFDAPADATEAMEIVVEDADAQVGLYSSDGGSGGSAIGLAEMSANAFANQWGLFRRTTGGGSTLQFTYGTDPTVAANPSLFNFGTNASLGIGDFPPNAETELFLTGSPSGSGTAADISLRPRAGDHLFNASVSGTDATNTTFSLQFAGASANYARRLGVTGTGSFGAGKNYGLAHGGSFVFADDSSATSFNTTGVNQFLVRADGGAAFNGTPVSNTELTLHAHAGDNSVDFAMRPEGSTSTFVEVVDGSDASDTRWRLLRRDGLGPIVLEPRLWFAGNGFLGVNGGFADPGFPLTIGTNTTNGNGARLTAGGVWTNGSSRTFKEAFSAIDVGDVLKRVLAMPITRWRYRQEHGVWHIGPVAEDFHAAFGLGESEQYIGTVDADGVALAAIQGLAARSEQRASQLERENTQLRATLDALAARVAALEQER